MHDGLKKKKKNANEKREDNIVNMKKKSVLKSFKYIDMVFNLTHSAIT